MNTRKNSGAQPGTGTGRSRGIRGRRSAPPWSSGGPPACPAAALVLELADVDSPARVGLVLPLRAGASSVVTPTPCITIR